jgi:hypothetical protein
MSRFCLRQLSMITQVDSLGNVLLIGERMYG